MKEIVIKYILWAWAIGVSIAFLIGAGLGIKGMYTYSKRVRIVEKPIACVGIARLEEEKRLQLKEIIELEADNKRLKDLVTQAIEGLKQCLK